MKNRFIGKITVTFPDGYVEECVVKERSDKGRDHFIDVLKENIAKILEQSPEGKVKVTYRGDFSRQIQDGLSKTEEKRR
jgi:hypothetical protein